jgi:hypothetical protein
MFFVLIEVVSAEAGQVGAKSSAHANWLKSVINIAVITFLVIFDTSCENGIIKKAGAKAGRVKGRIDFVHH